jgi:hypothetical protein
MPEQVSSNDQTHGDHNQRALRGGGPPTDSIGPSPETPPPKPNNSTPHDRNSQTIIARANVYMAIFSGLILLVNIGYVWVATQQWRAMGAQVTVMQDQVTGLKVQNGLISDEFTEMKTQSNFMKGQLIALENDQRPSISVEPKPPEFKVRPPQALGQILWNIFFDNGGKSTAIDFTYVAYLKIGDKPFHPAAGFEEPAALGKINVPPGKKSYVIESTPSISLDAFNQAMRQDRALGILVTLSYADYFGNKYAEPICFARLSNGAIQNIVPEDCKHD